MPSATFPTLVQAAPTTLEFGLVSNTQTFVSPLNGTVQTLEMPGARWRASFSFENLSDADAATLQAFLVTLRGQAGRFYLWNFARSTPRGAGTAAPGTTNLLKYSSFQSGFWNQSGTDPAVNTYVGTGGVDGSSYVQFRRTAATGYCGPNLTAASYTSTGTVTISVYVRVPTGVTPCDLSFYSGAGAPVVTTIATAATLAAQPRDVWVRYSATVTFTVAPSANSFINPGTGTTGQGFDLSAAQIEAGSTLTPYYPTTSAAGTRPAGPYVSGAGQTGATLYTGGWTASTTGVLKAGDFIGVNGELKMVTADATTDIFGNVTLSLEPPLRSSPANLATITTNKPTTTFMLTESTAKWVTRAPIISDVTIDCVEMF